MARPVIFINKNMSINQINNGDSGLTARNIINQAITSINELSTSGTASYASTASFTLSSSYAITAENVLSSSYALSASYTAEVGTAISASYALTASHAVETETSISSSYALSSSYSTEAETAISASYSSYATNADTASYIDLTPGSGIDINGTTISSRLVTVNGVQPVNGNATISLAGIISGTSASLILSSSGDVTSSIANSSLWVISNDPTPTNNGKAYIFNSGPPGQWYLVAPLDVAAGDARYLMLGPQSSLTNNLNLGGNNITNVGLLQGTSSWAVSASRAITASHALNVIPLGGGTGQIQYRINSTTLGGVSTLVFSGGVLRATGSFSGSLVGELTGTSSFAQSSNNAINAQTASFLPINTYNITSSWAISSSRSITASYINGSTFISTNPALSSSYALTASYALTSAGGNSITINNNTNNNIITATGTANTLNGESNLTFDGSTLAVTGKVTATSFTGSLQGTSSWAESSSRAITASYALVSSGTVTNAVNAQTASYALISQISLIQDYENGGKVSGTGNGETLAAYGYSAGSAATAFPLTNAEWGSISTSTTYDSCVWQEALLSFRSNRKSFYIQSADNKRYIINHKIYIPNTSSLGSSNNPYMFGIDGRGCMIKDTRTGAEASGGLFTRVPVNQTQANNYDVEYAISMQNMRIYGPEALPALSSSCAIEIGSSKRSYFANLDISRYDIGFRGSMMLNCTMDRINTIFCDTAGVKFERGWWPNAGQATTVNQVSITNCRFNTSLSSSVGLWLENCDSTEGYKLQFEGASGSYGLFYDSTSGATVVKNAYFRNLRFESEGNYGALIGFKGRDTFSFIAELGWYQETISGFPGYLIETEAYQGSPIIILRDWGFGSNQNTWKIKNIDNGYGQCAFDITNVRLSASNFGGSLRGPQTAAEILASSSLYFDGLIPTSNRLRFTPLIP